MSISFPEIDISGSKVVPDIGVGLGAAALVFALLAKSQVSAVEGSLDVSHSVSVGANLLYEEGDEVRYESVYDEDGNYLGDVALTRDLNIILRDGSLKLLDSTIHLPYTDSSGETDDIYVYLDGENTVQYNSSDGYVVVNDNIIIKTISADDATYIGVADFESQYGEPILIGERLVTEETAIAVLYTLSEDSTIDSEDVELVQNILNYASADTPIENLTICGADANTDWAEEIVMTERAVQLIKGNLSVYITPYTGSFADGTTNTLEVGDLTITYCESAVDTETGYIPYIYEFTEDQGGLIEVEDSDDIESLCIKLLSTTNGTVKNLFTIK